MIMKMRSVSGALLLAVSTCAFVWFMGPNPSEGVSFEDEKPATPGPGLFLTSVARETSSSAATPASELKTYLAQLPLGSTVEDIDIDGQVRIDKNGNLVLDPGLRRYLDFFIGLTRSPADEPAMKSAMVAAMNQLGIPADVQAEVLGILDDYLAYRGALEALELEARSDAAPADLELAFGKIYSLRRQYLGEDVAQGFFGEEEAGFNALLARKRILESEALSEAERQRALEAIEQSRPEEVRAVREQAVSVVNVRRQVEALRAQGASEEEIFTVRAAQFGVESAERLAKLDTERQAWEQRLSLYREQKARLEARADLSQDAREQAIEALRREHFAEHEARRVRVLDRL